MKPSFYRFKKPKLDDREELWKAVAIAVAASGNSKTMTTMAAWADRAVADFEKRFGESAEKSE